MYPTVGKRMVGFRRSNFSMGLYLSVNEPQCCKIHLGETLTNFRAIWYKIGLQTWASHLHIASICLLTSICTFEISLLYFNSPYFNVNIYLFVILCTCIHRWAVHHVKFHALFQFPDTLEVAWARPIWFVKNSILTYFISLPPVSQGKQPHFQSTA